MAALYMYKQLHSEIKLLGNFFILSTAVELFILVTSEKGIPNIWLFNVFGLIEGIVLFYICGKWSGTQRAFYTIIFLFLLYVVYWIYNFYLSPDISQFNDKGNSLKGILLIIISGFVFIRITKDNDMINKDYRFWILSAILIYFGVGTIIFATANYILDNTEKAMTASWNIHSIVNVISNVLYAYGFRCYYQYQNLPV